MDPRLLAAIQARARMLEGGGSPSPITMNGPAQDVIAQRFAPPPSAPTVAPGSATAAWAETQVSQRSDGGGGGFGGMLGAVLNNPLARAVLRPLQAFDIPRATVVSGLKELQDWSHGGSPDLGDFASQAAGGIGFRDVVGSPTGNEWLDKGIGFAGDVALDPLTYVTFGAGRFAGASGRLAAAGELAVLAENTTDEGVRVLAKSAAERVARLGVSSLKPEERALIPGLDRAGLRMVGSRIPGTEGVAEAVGRAGGEIRSLAHRTPVLGEALRRGPGRGEELLQATERLFSGRGDLDPIDAINKAAAHYAEKSTAGIFRHAQVKKAEAVAKVLGHSNKARVNLTHAIERGEAGELPTLGRDLLSGIRDEGLTHGIKLEELGSGKVPYVPHRLTNYGVDLMSKSDAAETIVVNKGAASAAQKQRLLVKGQRVTIGGKSAKITDDSIDGLNKFFRTNFGAHSNVFEDDFVKLTDSYIEEVSRSVGRAAGIGRLQAGGSAWARNDPFVSRPSKAALQAAQKGSEFEAATVAKRGVSESFKPRPLWHDVEEANLARRGEQLTLDFADTPVAGNGDDVVAAVVDNSTAHAEYTAELKRLSDEGKLTLAPDGRIKDSLNLDNPEYVAARQRYLQATSAPERSVILSIPEVDAKLTAEKADQFLQAAKSGKFDKPIERELKYGFERIGKDLLADPEGVVVRAQLANSLNNVQKAIHKHWLWKATDAYTAFFKQYATLSPGFHLRNGMSAAFMNFSDGVGLSSQLKGIKEWTRYMGDPEHFVENTAAEERKLLDDAVKAVYGGGGGAGQYSADELIIHGPRAVDHPLTRVSRKAGGGVEGVVRMGMAIDTLKKGGSIEEAIARISRIHFDYSEVSKLDRTMKKIVPFWTFMSRNLPLQTQQMWLKPRLYQQYQSLVRNMGQDYEGDMVPQSWQDLDAFKLSDGSYFAPDFAHTRQLKNLEELGDLQGGRFLSDVNPLYRLPLELWVADKQFFSGHKFQPNTFEQVDQELLPFLPVLAGLGQVEHGGPQGDIPVVDEKWAYALRQLIPTLAQSQRLAPGNDPYYGDRQLQSILSWAGIPYKQLSEGTVSREQERRQRNVGADDAAARARAEALRKFVSGG